MRRARSGTFTECGKLANDERAETNGGDEHAESHALRARQARATPVTRPSARETIFARDGYRCVYCGNVFESEELSIDHVQPRMRGGDGSQGNVVTACRGCNTAKAGRRLSQFLADAPVARRNFFRYARYVWPRHLKAVAEELAHRGVVERSEDFVEGVRGLRRSEAAAVDTVRDAHTAPRTDPAAE